MTLMATPSQPVTHQPAVVKVAGYFYDVRFFEDGEEFSGLNQRIHRVGKDRRCTCQSGASCPAVTAVSEYLKAGGERAPDPPPGYYPAVPIVCPICLSEAIYAPTLSSKQRGIGWRCRKGGSRHYWQTQVKVLQQKLAANPWLFPPVVLRDGQRLLAYEGIEPDDRVLYPGVRRSEIIN